MADNNTNGQLSEEHAAFLTAQAVDLDLARSLGVRSLLSKADNPDEGLWVNWANHPAILFPWVNDDGDTEIQLRPDNPTEDTRGRLRKYVFRKDMQPILWAVRPVPDAATVVIVEGTKQVLAAASYAPEGMAIYGISGCRSWQVDGTPIPDLCVVDGKDVVVILDADAATNPQVFDAGMALASALGLEGANKVRFSRMTGADKAGLDDILGRRKPHTRANYLARIISGAKAKPADAKPRGKGTGGEGRDGRPLVICNDDRREVIESLTDALKKRWDGRQLFCHGGVLSRMRNARMTPLERGAFGDLVQETCVTMNRNEGAQGTTLSFTWPDAPTMSAAMSRATEFSLLERVSHAPFVRPDGTVVTDPGYDEATRTMLVPDPVFEGLTVPESPSPEEVAAARNLIMTEWLGDFPFDSDADRANAMALVVTPAIRGMVPKVPMAVVDGLQMGVGKNLIADSLLTVYTGEAAQPMNWVEEPDEVRKQITAAFRTGAEFFVFDEAHTLEGAPLAQALTAATWQDRILGVSTMAEFPNRVTWISLGNQVHVKGDLTRRVYRISLKPNYSAPHDRPASSFRHPGQSGLDLLSWTRKHRRELMTAVLTLVRAWFAAGQPYPKRGVSFGSFEVWERITSGIVETAGLPGFLDNIKVWRSESDFDGQYWINHLKWLREQFGTAEFRTAEVKDKAQADPALFMAPPRLDDPNEKGFTKSLGEAYSRHRQRRMNGYWIDRTSMAHGHVSLWTVRMESDLPPAPGIEPDPDPTPNPSPEPDIVPDIPQDDPQPVDNVVPVQVPEAEPVRTDTRADTDLVTFDLETGDAGDLHKSGPGFVHIGATARDDAEVVAYERDVPTAVAADVRSGRTITGHNIMAFDLPALVNEGALSMSEVHELARDGRVFDAMLAARYVDPPMARDKGVDQKRKYDLGTLGQTYGLGEKMTDVSGALAKKYGGWDGIPFDTADPDPERAADAVLFRDYMVQDVQLSRRLHAALMEKLGGTVPDYLRREHRVAAVAAQISMNGFLVDQPLLADRVIEVETRKSRYLAWLVENAGVPTTNAKGAEYKSPLATKAGKGAIEKALTEAGATSLWRTATSGDLDLSGEHMKHLAREYHHLPQVRKIAIAVSKIVGARSVYQTISDHVAPDGRVHPKIGFDQATGRWSVTSPGLTVLGKRGGRHVERAVLLPDPGEVLISADLSQVDMRAIAGLSQDQAYIRMLDSEDPHAELAVALFGDVGRREDAKAIGHGWNYGESLKKISESNEIDPVVVRRFDTSMRERFPRLVEWREEVRAQAESGALLDNGFGRKMRADPQRAHTQAPALSGQGCARDIMAEGLLRLPPEVLPMLRAQIHDEVVLSVPEDRVEEIGRVVVDALSLNGERWRGVAIGADVSRSGRNWAEPYAKG